MTRPATVDAYIEAAPPPAQSTLRQLRQLIRATPPQATERISYGMPSYDYRGEQFVHFAAAKGHVGVYGLVHEDGDVPPELALHLAERSTLRFRLGEPLSARALAALRRKAARRQGHLTLRPRRLLARDATTPSWPPARPSRAAQRDPSGSRASLPWACSRHRPRVSIRVVKAENVPHRPR